jgi:hypothetical protein
MEVIDASRQADSSHQAAGLQQAEIAISGCQFAVRARLWLADWKFRCGVRIDGDWTQHAQGLPIFAQVAKRRLRRRRGPQIPIDAARAGSPGPAERMAGT